MQSHWSPGSDLPPDFPPALPSILGTHEKMLQQESVQMPASNEKAKPLWLLTNVVVFNIVVPGSQAVTTT